MFNDRRELDATVVGSDERTDVALLKVNGTNFPSLRCWECCINCAVGEPVLAIGSPFGFDYWASAGIVSAKMRNMMGERQYPLFKPMWLSTPETQVVRFSTNRGKWLG